MPVPGSYLRFLVLSCGGGYRQQGRPSSDRLCCFLFYLHCPLQMLKENPPPLREKGKATCCHEVFLTMTGPEHHRAGYYSQFGISEEDMGSVLHRDPQLQAQQGSFGNPQCGGHSTRLHGGTWASFLALPLAGCRIWRHFNVSELNFLFNKGKGWDGMMAKISSNFNIL